METRSKKTDFLVRFAPDPRRDTVVGYVVAELDGVTWYRPLYQDGRYGVTDRIWSTLGAALFNSKNLPVVPGIIERRDGQGFGIPALYPTK
jgi:hypothetical protein